ncbi:Imm40 family immunity protein [Butyrivibrio fibrisolvens]|uniref:Imm40 family immunity protein n=1 Tax=Butyrivibrio fibrisolvens TaxID=831 RepID=UPI0003B668FA|nr:Imm40 family immunity protein [Butyrivibrio fibrisolvens]
MLVNEIIENNSIEAISLEKIGINGYACTYRQVCELISIFRVNQITILGGDVFVYDNEKIKLTYDSWYVTDKEKCDYELSYKKAIDYINIFESKEGVFLYSLVVGKVF